MLYFYVAIPALIAAFVARYVFKVKITVICETWIYLHVMGMLVLYVLMEWERTGQP